MTFLAALRCDRIEAPWVLDGPINGESFHVDQVRAPTLKPGDVVILDNLGSHKGKAVRRAIRASGARLSVLAALFPRPQPHRTGLRQTETSSCERPRSEPSTLPGNAPAHCSETFKSSECKKLLHQCRLRFIPKNDHALRKKLGSALEWTGCFADRQPGPGEIRVKVAACGVCRTDLHVVDGGITSVVSPPHWNRAMCYSHSCLAFAYSAAIRCKSVRETYVSGSHKPQTGLPRLVLEGTKWNNF